MSPGEFAQRKLASISALRAGGKIGPAPGWESDISDSILLLHTRGAFIHARAIEIAYADDLQRPKLSDKMGTIYPDN
jgi:hypothetical protein